VADQAVETQTIPLGEASFADYAAARAKGNTTTVDVPKEKPAESKTEETPATPSGAQAESRSDTDKEPSKSTEGKSEPDEPWTPAMQAALDKRIKRELAKVRKEYAEGYSREEPEKPAPQVQAQPQEDREPALSPQPTADEIRAHSAWTQRQTARMQAAMNQQFMQEQEAVQQFPDWRETVGKATANVLTSAQTMIRTLPSEVNRAVLHHLATEADFRDKFNAMSDGEQVQEVLKLSASLLPSGSKKPAQRSKPESQAPEPITPVAANTKSSPTPLDQMSYKDYEKARREGRTR
jgi:hypothetical protein